MRLHLDDIHYIDTAFPMDVSIPINSDGQNVSAWHVDPPKFEIVRAH